MPPGWSPDRTQPRPTSPTKPPASAPLGRAGRYAVRSATPADTPHIHGFVRELAAFEKLEHEVVLSAERMRADFEAGRFEALLAETADEGKPVGFALFFPVYSTFEGPGLYLEDLYVSPSARGDGCGTLLLRTLASIAASRDCARMQWQALDWNEKAIEFYKSVVGARERVGDDGTTWVNFIMERDAIAKLAS